MLFNSFIFFIFLGVVLPVFYFLKKKEQKVIWLLFASYFFYGYWDWRFCGLLIISSLADFIIGQKIYSTNNEKKRKQFLWLSITINLGILGFFKYFNFFVDSFENIFSISGLKADYLHLNIILPVGISFYTFQTLSYTIDIYRKRIEPTKNLLDFALFVSFFPQLVAGPIERAKTLLPQIAKISGPSRLQVQQGIELIIMGLFRKVLIGDTAGRYSDHIFANVELYPSIELISGLLLFTIQIYADFSGYSHIARGTAKLLGIELMKNFEQPYLSRNITEFWRRWHISLSTWLRDYLYISLGGNRKGISRTYINLMITMLLGGLWHGASWNFVIWGALHGIYLAIHKFFLTLKKEKSSSIQIEANSNLLKRVPRIMLTFSLVAFTWLFFRATSWSDTILFFEGIANWKPSEFALRYLLVVKSFFIVSFALDYLEYKSGHHSFMIHWNKPFLRAGILSALFLSTLIYMFQAPPSPFIYFQF